GLAGIFAKGAIAAVIATERGKRNEQLLGIGDRGSLSAGPELGRKGQEFGEWSVVRQLESGDAINRSVERGRGLEKFHGIHGRVAFDQDASLRGHLPVGGSLEAVLEVRSKPAPLKAKGAAPAWQNFAAW